MTEDTKELVERMKALPYFHSIDFGDWKTESWVYPGNVPKNTHLFSVFQLLQGIGVKGQYCLDMGTYDGLTAFILAAMGGKVVATCQFDREQFRLAHQYLCEQDAKFSSVNYIPGFHLEDAHKYSFESKFDLIVLSAALHHMLSPLVAITTLRNLLKENGLLILEVAFVDGDQPAFFLNTEVENPVEGIPTIFIPTRSAVEGALKFCSFEILGAAELDQIGKEGISNYKRIAFVAKATKPSVVPDRTPQLMETHRKSPFFHYIDFNGLEQDDSQPSTISYTGDKYSLVDTQTFQAQLPLQPKFCSV